jgi:hypothetical protein
VVQTTISPTKLGIHFDSFIDVLQCLWESHQFHICSRTVVVTSSIGRITLNALRVVLDGSSKIASLKLGVSFLASNGTLFRVNVCFAVFLRLETFEFAQFREDVGCAVFCE